MSLQALIEEKMRAELAPSHLDVINESGGHGNSGGESHFKVIVVSDKFDGKPLLARHRMVNAALREELVEDIHALSMVTRTPAQWAAEGGKRIEPSPPCAGGSASR
ncbi:unnamed protein product [Hapterophycus canaliculatus]